MGQTAESIGANVFQFFTRNPRGGAAKPIDKQDVRDFLAFAAEKGIGPILAHAPYTLNAAGAEERVREFAEQTMADDLRRLELTPGALYNFHPGSHVGQGAEQGIELIASMLARILDARYRNDLPTLIVTNLGFKDHKFDEYVGPLVASRIRECADLVDCTTTDFRKSPPQMEEYAKRREVI